MKGKHLGEGITTGKELKREFSIVRGENHKTLDSRKNKIFIS